jgi:NitT/TauT family transport system permease protein
LRRLINQRPARGEGFALGALPFVALLVVYVVASKLRLAENGADKLLPSFGSMAQAFSDYALTEDPRSGRYLFWADTWASLRRIGLALALSASLSLVIALAIGAIPRVRALLSPLLSTVAMIPPLAVLPILFIVLGLEETAKVSLIIIGILPQTLPRLIDSLRLNMGSAWLFLIAAEAIASTEGLGYRIFLVRRYLAMDVILPYVAWITLLAVGADLLLRLLRARAFHWAEPGR